MGLRRGKGHGQLRDLIGAHAILHAFHTGRRGLVLDRDGGDHARPGKGGDDIRAHRLDRALHGDNARQAHHAQLGCGIIGLADITDQARGRGE